MARFLLKIKCGCHNSLCERALRVTEGPHPAIRVEILEGDDSVACVLLQREEAQELARWLTGETPKVESTKKTKKAKKELMPWQGVE